MSATTESDRMNFRTQIVDGKPQIFFEPIEESTTKTRSKRNSRAINNGSRMSEQKNNSKHETKRVTIKTDQPTNKKRTNEDGAGLGVYMTMDEIAELVSAVKETSKNETNGTMETKAQPYYEPAVVPVVPKLDLALEPPPLPPSQVSPRDEALGQMAEKKRQKWMREKAEIERMQMEIEYDRLKHQLSPRHKKEPSSPQRSTFQYDFPPPTHKVALAPPPNVPPLTHKPPPAPPLPQSLRQNGHQHDVPTRMNEESSQDTYKTQLMEKKQQQWKQENSEKMPFWDPFGRPGAGAPKNHENPPRTSQPLTNTQTPYRPSLPTQQPSTFDNSSSSLPSYMNSNEQSRLPAAMRTNLAFGNTRPEDDVKTAQEIERRQWLGDLHKQIEENKRQKNALQETERRQDFLRDNVQPLMQEAANRHQQSTSNYNGQDFNKYNQHDSSMHRTDATTNAHPGSTSNQKTGDHIFGSTYDTSTKYNPNYKSDPIHLNVGSDQQQPYRRRDGRRDEAVNTVDATFRSDHGIQNDLRIPPNRRLPPNPYDDIDLPPQVPNHHYHRNAVSQPNKKTTRTQAHDDHQSTRYTSTANHTGTTSQMNSHRTNHRPGDLQHRPIWNYNANKRGEYVPNSKRDPNYETRQRMKHLELGNFDRIDDVQPRTCYNRWNSDGEIQQQQKKQASNNRTRSTVPRAPSHGHHKDESIMNLLKGHSKQSEHHGTNYPPSNPVRTEPEYNPHQPPSSSDRYDNYMSYARSEERSEPPNVYSSPVSQPIQSSPQKQIPNTSSPSRDWNNANRQQHVAPPVQYNEPTTKQEHILQQLSSIKENLIRRQRELASPNNAIPV